jgi:hypothetical protein
MLLAIRQDHAIGVPTGYTCNAREKKLTASKYEYTSPSSTLVPMSHLKTSGVFKFLTRLAYAHR